MKLFAILAVMMLTYVSIFLGSCSPIHCRFTLTFLGIAIITLSTFAARGLCFMFDFLTIEMHEALPLLMLGIGVDDMFVMCNAVD